MPNAGNNIALLHPSTLAYQIALVVCIGGKHIVAVTHNNQISIAGEPIVGINHLTCCRRMHWRPFFSSDINTVMRSPLSSPEPAGHFAIKRPAQTHCS